VLVVDFNVFFVILLLLFCIDEFSSVGGGR